VDPTAGAVREAAQRGLARGGVAVGAGAEDQAGPAEERGGVDPRVCGAPGAADGGRSKQIWELERAEDEPDQVRLEEGPVAVAVW
jgi:hypothetical protein